MNSGKDLVAWVADVLVVVGLAAATFVYEAPGVFVALFFYGIFRHVYATICVEYKTKGSRCLCDEPFWNVLDLAIVGTMLATGYVFAYTSYAWPYVGTMFYVALRHIFYACFHHAPVEPQPINKRSFEQLASVVLDFAMLVGFMHSIFSLHDYTGPIKDRVLASTHEAAGLALAGLIIYAVFRHIFEAVCVGYNANGSDYLSEQLFYNLWDLLVIGTAFTAGFAWGAPAPIVAAVLMIVARFILWACIKTYYPREDSKATA